MEKIEDGDLIGPTNGTVMGDAQLVTGKRVWPSIGNGYVSIQPVDFGNHTGNALSILSPVLVAG